MPNKRAPTREEFEDFDKKMTAIGFIRLSPQEIEEDRHRLGLESPRRQREPGSEVGYCFQSRELKVKVWTTWLEEKGSIREHDQGWVLIVRGDRALHFEHPFNRTKKFLERLCKFARINRDRLRKRPECPHCGRWMQIAQGVELKFRAWACNNIQKHPEQAPEVYSFTYGLPLQMVKYEQRDARRSRRYRQKREEAGLPNFVAMLGRKKTVVTRPENIEFFD